MTVIYPSLNKLWKTFIKVVKMSHFVFYRSKRSTQKNVFEVDQELRVGNRPPGKKKTKIPAGMPKGGMVTT